MPTPNVKNLRVKPGFADGLFIASLWVCLASCGAAKVEAKTPAVVEKPRPGNLNPIQVERSDTGVVERLDLNGDQTPDVFKFYTLVANDSAPAKGPPQMIKALVRKELDVNFDGRTDVVEFYSGAPGKEVKDREEVDFDFDGQVNQIRRYKDGFVYEVAQDQNRDYKIDTWLIYQLTKNEEGKDINRLVERRRDHNSDGLVDVWEFYVKGALQKISRDTNGDGRPDVQIRVDANQR